MDRPDQSNDTPQQPETPESTPPAGAQNTDHMIPKTRFDEVNEKYKALREQLDTLKAEREKAAQEELAEQNRWKELYEKTQQEIEALKADREQKARYEEALAATNQSRVEQIPQEKRSIVPEFDDPMKLSAWLDKNLHLLLDPGKPKAPNLDGGAGDGGSSAASSTSLDARTQAIADIARQYGHQIDDARLADYKRQQRTITEPIRKEQKDDS